MEGGTVTAGNSSPLSDGAAALVLCSEKYLKQHSKCPDAVYEVLSSAEAEKLPIEFTTAPSVALPLAAKRANIALNDLAAIEINEAFAVVGAANTSLMQLDINKVNTRGGAVAMGHPLGCSGARIVVTLAHRLNSGELGGAAVCNGGGGASAVIIKRTQ